MGGASPMIVDISASSRLVAVVVLFFNMRKKRISSSYVSRVAGELEFMYKLAIHLHIPRHTTGTAGFSIRHS